MIQRLLLANWLTARFWPETPSGYAMSRSLSSSGFLDLMLCRRLSPARQMAAPAVSLGDHHEQFPKTTRKSCNKGKIIGQKTPFRPKDIWSIRVRLQMQHRAKELALFNLGFDS